MKNPIPKWLMNTPSSRQFVEDVLNHGKYRYIPSKNKQQYIHIDMDCHILYKPQRRCLNFITYIADALFLSILISILLLALFFIAQMYVGLAVALFDLSENFENFDFIEFYHSFAMTTVVLLGLFLFAKFYKGLGLKSYEREKYQKEMMSAKELQEKVYLLIFFQSHHIKKAYKILEHLKPEDQFAIELGIYLKQCEKLTKNYRTINPNIIQKLNRPELIERIQKHV